MNLVDAYVTEVLSEPEEAEGLEGYIVRVAYDSWGSVSETSLYFNTLQEAYLVDEGYKFVC